VYLKELDARGFVIYSNWATSHKAADVATNPQAALAFWWREVERQVRVEGTVERLSPEESQRYFDLRARGSKIGAWASQQSMVLEGGRPELEDRVWEAGVRFRDTPDGEIPVPAFWGGARIVPRVLEFWQGRESRLHDRFRYTRVEGGEGEGEWRIERLSP
jgi:pyridoxamine 5'-phosphate oxidase